MSLRIVVVGAGDPTAVGASRGAALIRCLRAQDLDAEMTGICDVSPTALAPWREEGGVTCYEDYADVLADDRVDAVVLATPADRHLEQSVDALAAGKHVLCEVPAVLTIAGCRELVAAAEASRGRFMLAENYCFRREIMAVQRMVESEVFGQPTMASGGYVHDCRAILFRDDGTPTWRGRLWGDFRGNPYPTHAFGPVARWLGLGRDDRLVSSASWAADGRGLARYSRERFAPDLSD